jgi:Glycosyl transferase family 2
MNELPLPLAQMTPDAIVVNNGSYDETAAILQRQPRSAARGCASSRIRRIWATAWRYAAASRLGRKDFIFYTDADW